MDSMHEHVSEHSRAYYNQNFKALAPGLHQTFSLFVTKYRVFKEGINFMPVDVLYQLHTSAFFLREECQRLTPIMGVTDPGAEKFVQYYYELTANMRLIDERRHALIVWREAATTKYKLDASISYDQTSRRNRFHYDWTTSYLHLFMELETKERIGQIIAKCAVWREQYETHRTVIEANDDLPRPKPQYIGENGRDLIRERVDCSREETDVLIKKMAGEDIDSKAFTTRCNNFLDTDHDLVMQLGNEILQRQDPIREK